MNFEKFKNELIDKCEEIGLKLENDPFDLWFTKSNYIRGNRSKRVYGGEISDYITLKDNFAGSTEDEIPEKRSIEIIVNNNSYVMKYYPDKDEYEYSFAKLFINGMFYCLGEKERRKITEKTFKKALDRFIKLNSLQQLRQEV